MSAGRNMAPSSSAGPQSHQIFCCAFNANGTVFVTGSSDTLARVHLMMLFTSYLACICLSFSCFAFYLVIMKVFIIFTHSIIMKVFTIFTRFISRQKSSA